MGMCLLVLSGWLLMCKSTPSFDYKIADNGWNINGSIET
jgi:hypothetical protein